MRKGFKYFIICILSIFTLASSSIPNDYTEKWLAYWDTYSCPSPFTEEEILAIHSIPDQYRNWFVCWAKKYDVSIPIAVSIAMHESGFVATARNYNLDKEGFVWSVDRGIFQINSYYEDSFAKAFYHNNKKAFDPFNPEDNIQVGLAILKDLRDYFGNDVQVIRAFNIGLPTEARGWNVIKGDEYYAKVMKTYDHIMEPLSEKL
jgi:hypothetical protein